MRYLQNGSNDMLLGLIKELKGCHRRITEYESLIARERQIIASTIEAHQARLANKQVQLEGEGGRSSVGGGVPSHER